MERAVKVLEGYRPDWRYVTADGHVIGLIVKAGGQWWPCGMAWCEGWGFDSPQEAGHRVAQEVLREVR
jgi:hypothetical protein